MTKNPFINALSATAYIILIASIMTLGTKNMKGPDTVMAPIVALSVFTLSAGVMGYLFLLQPLLLYLEGKKKAGVALFIKTLGTFALTTGVILTLFFTRILK
ncbi:hypothetical protein A3G67_02660 [Candidatus Roizmanbacteria bacterium RIFCSPLOWO2_12_FULL_40_12]|uniref:Uncharacterized protein n=1 Tax=Candidatus Roizmanbacteria bacterium RIFCSPLOWO2_01_FULL_40_42 TaxID=1802066 RepID=A0A1F7J651_9BACT|nr:MAG: hypothetical protein A2779_03950 [Candidatus Roizmanbacteria bacterium RIFCSPHIGHO2_01_FULL_40_98]OGK28653.1 MAG: hypothetical protein A3C31_01510 [Candidatus Roizmanbacteria bacterium RIFCSPHIGHO2_02_FULL_40_53]OGK29435.1 MAG: hypothetical protein A2W49_04280 [Candidatus Roizmanbacteria bacterium RIFCSPHIGHO2_12_41_18]OGK36637.1 MAG: hypothetical protein A3E69_00180 [Candidatus Roizmanbacteria bacterium RIFCSPHIGHO2_12_FULL_40_130]OGK51076.1 MAG: hypothetical protein A3B50_02835 [Candi